MLLSLIHRHRVLTSVLKASQTYKGSATQKKMHEFDQNQEEIRKVKSTIDYEIINKQSQGCMMIREFLFQEKQTQYQINFPHKTLLPSGKWSLQEMQKMIEEQQIEGTPSEAENVMIFKKLDKDLGQKFSMYYNNIGKKDYTFSVKEEIQKIESMTAEQFEAFMERLRG